MDHCHDPVPSIQNIRAIRHLKALANIFCVEPRCRIDKWETLPVIPALMQLNEHHYHLVQVPASSIRMKYNPYLHRHILPELLVRNNQDHLAALQFAAETLPVAHNPL